MIDQEFSELLRGGGADLSEDAISRIGSFRDWVVKENEQQNLTRLVSPSEFYEGHVLDALALLKSGLLESPSMDLGSGAGVPGLVCALLGNGPWVLAESEGRKAEFLSRVTQELGLGDCVAVFSGRAEEYLKLRPIRSVVARAVGPVSRIYSWLRPCSTWNSLVLMKGPAWPQEWESFLSTKWRRELRIDGEYSYSVGAEQKKRLIIRLKRATK
jgi:16S rRNA (guanine527-N7)-methyltransferase